ncbi:hypothetical protein LAB1_09810 [Roseibium sp. LAB1]
MKGIGAEGDFTDWLPPVFVMPPAITFQDRFTAPLRKHRMKMRQQTCLDTSTELAAQGGVEPAALGRCCVRGKRKARA